VAKRKTKSDFLKISTTLSLLILISLVYLVSTNSSIENPSPIVEGQTSLTLGSNLNPKTPSPAPPTNPPITSSPTISTSTIIASPVQLSLLIPDQDYELCCGLIPTKIKVWGEPTIQNLGGMKAHNVKVTFELFTLDGERIKLSGEDQVKRELGNLQGGESITERIEFMIELVDGYQIQGNGAVAVFNIYSDEMSRRFEEEFLVPSAGS
jgi:hypothetical protein